MASNHPNTGKITNTSDTNQIDMSAPVGQQAASDDTDCVVDELDPSTHLERIKLLTKVVEEQRRQLANKSREISDKEKEIEQLKAEISVFHNERRAKIMEEELEAWRIRRDEFTANFDSFSQSDTLVQLTADQLADVLSRDDLHASSEGVVLDALHRWIQSDEDSRKGHLLRLLELVRLKYVDLDRLGALLMRYEDSPADEQVSRLVQRVINNRSLPHRYPIEEMQPRTGIARTKQEAGLSYSLAKSNSVKQSYHPQAGTRQPNILPPSAMCSLCIRIATDPIQLAKCRHLFCRICIQEWLEIYLTCPVCRRARVFVLARTKQEPRLSQSRATVEPTQVAIQSRHETQKHQREIYRYRGRFW